MELHQLPVTEQHTGSRRWRLQRWAPRLPAAERWRRGRPGVRGQPASEAPVLIWNSPLGNTERRTFRFQTYLNKKKRIIITRASPATIKQNPQGFSTLLKFSLAIKNNIHYSLTILFYYFQGMTKNVVFWLLWGSRKSSNVLFRSKMPH